MGSVTNEEGKEEKAAAAEEGYRAAERETDRLADVVRITRNTRDGASSSAQSRAISLDEGGLSVKEWPIRG